MSNNTQTAQATQTTMIRGDTIAIDAVTDKGRGLSTLVRISFEYAEFLEERITEQIGDLFADFADGIENVLTRSYVAGPPSGRSSD